jgi:hypothetical protein
MCTFKYPSGGWFVGNVSNFLLFERRGVSGLFGSVWLFNLAYPPVGCLGLRLVRKQIFRYL